MVWGSTKNSRDWSLLRCNLKRQNEVECCELLLLSLYDDCVGEFTVLMRFRSGNRWEDQRKKVSLLWDWAEHAGPGSSVKKFMVLKA